MIAIYHGQYASRYQDLLQAEGIEGVKMLDETVTADELHRVTGLLGWKVPQSVLAAMPNLRWVQSLGAGVDWLNGMALPPYTTLTRVVDLFGTDMAEYALLASLMWVKNVQRWQRAQVSHRWDPFVVGSLSTQRVGVVGAGSIGREIARAFLPWAQEVRALGRTLPQIEGVQGFDAETTMEFFKGLNIVIVVLPLTPETTNFVGRGRLEQMALGSLLINVGRGPVVDLDAVVDALKSGRLDQAVLDVFPTEPLPSSSYLWDVPGLVISPHVSGPSRPERVVKLVARNIQRFQAGQPLEGVVNWQRGY